MPSVMVIVYDPSTGAILSRRTMPESDAMAQPAPCLVMPLPSSSELPDDSTHWVNAGVLMPRPAMPLTIHKAAIAADGVDQARIIGIPPGAVMNTSNEPPVSIDDEELLWASELVGNFQLVFSLFPYLDATVTVTAT